MSLTVLIYLLAAVAVVRLVTHFKPSLLESFTKQQRHSMREGADGLFWAGVAALLIVQFLARPFYIPSESMLPTLRINDFLLVNRAIYHITEPVRGEIVVFETPERPEPGEHPKHLIKRVVGVEGDLLQLTDGLVTLNGLAMEEDYLNEEIWKAYMGGHVNPGQFRVKKGHIFVMGDNRNHSNDSRYIGEIPLENLVGRAEVRFFPFTRLKSFNFPRSSFTRAGASDKPSPLAEPTPQPEPSPLEEPTPLEQPTPTEEPTPVGQPTPLATGEVLD